MAADLYPIKINMETFPHWTMKRADIIARIKLTSLQTLTPKQFKKYYNHLKHF